MEDLAQIISSKIDSIPTMNLITSEMELVDPQEEAILLFLQETIWQLRRISLVNLHFLLEGAKL